VEANVLKTLQASGRHTGSLSSALRHLGALGLFWLAVLDSSPVPTFGGPDIATALLAATHRNSWFEYAAVATAGSVLGAYLTFRLAQRAGMAYLHSKFAQGRNPMLLRVFARWGTGALVCTTAIPFPFPTSLFFAMAGAFNYGRRKFLAVVVLARGARYSLIAILAEHYGRHFVRLVRHPDRYWGWLLLFVAIVLAIIIAIMLFNKHLQAVAATDEQTVSHGR
jgi:membrane protein YqaA with SNARE-associated domain